MANKSALCNSCRMAGTSKYCELCVNGNRLQPKEPGYSYMYGPTRVRDEDIVNVMPNIKNVIFNPPATIVFWDDNSKTVVKCRADEEFDPEKGLVMAVAKRALGNKYEYYNQILHWLKKYEAPAPVEFKFKIPDLSEIMSKFDRPREAFHCFNEETV